MTLLFKQRMFAWIAKYEIFDEEGNTLYTVKGKLAMGHKLFIYDAQENHIATLREELFHMMPHFKIIIGDEEVGVLKGKFALMHPKFELDFCGWQVLGDFWQWNYQVTDASGGRIATVQKKIWHMTDTYSIEVDDPANALMSLMVVLAIDAAKQDNQNVEAASMMSNN